IPETLLALREAGLGSLPGGGAEIFDDRVHDQAFKGKVRADKWFEVHRTAHSLGIPSNATMLYGHLETPSERISHLVKLRQLQADSLAAIEATKQQSGEAAKGAEASVASPLPPPSVASSPRRSVASPPPLPSVASSLRRSVAAFNCMIPLSFVPDRSELGHLPGPTGLTDLKTLAIARLMLHNIPHIKAFWIMQGIGLSQLALDFGCDDLDGTVVWYDITKRNTSNSTHQELHLADIHRLIRESGYTPVERDTLYHPLRRDPQSDQLLPTA
ncbi:MAG: hypothetical protein ACM359_10385, partial [Bacillota bacterium]